MSQRYLNDLRRLYNQRVSSIAIRSGEYIQPSLENGDVYNISLKIDLSKNEFIVPEFACQHFYEVFNNRFNSGNNRIRNYDDGNIINIPLVVRRAEYKRSFDSIIHSFFNEVPNRTQYEHLLKITTNKGEVYYGNRGFILDKDFNPVIIYGVKCSIEKNELNKDVFHVNELVLNINNNIFINKDIVSKNIIKKLIPDSFIYDYHYYNFQNTYYEIKKGMNKHPTIIINDMNDYIYKPSMPPLNMDESINDFLIDNLETIIKYF